MDDPDKVMHRIFVLFHKSGKTLKEIGVAMGYEGEVACKAVWQFLHKTSDPRLSMLRRFAKAMDITVEELLAEDKRRVDANRFPNAA